MKPALKSPEQETRLRDWLAARGEPAYRFDQVRSWLYRRCTLDFDRMANLPLSLRRELADRWQAFALTPTQELSAPDGTRKFLFRLADGAFIESVLIRSGQRTTACISTQAGCSVGCVFCATGRAGLVRDLHTAEIVDQVIYLCKALGGRVRNVVVMGMGEPLLNLGAVIPALECLCDPDRLDVGDRHVTVSTSGIVPGMIELARCRRQWNLAVSLHAATDPLRRRLIPARHRYPVAEIAEACRTYRAETRRMVTFEYVLLAGVNDSDTDCRALADLARSVGAKVNLIPYNRTEAGFHSPSKCRIDQFAAGLRNAGIACSVRQSRGSAIQGACGQLHRLSAGSPRDPA